MSCDETEGDKRSSTKIAQYNLFHYKLQGNYAMVDPAKVNMKSRKYVIKSLQKFFALGKQR
jgi:hypothetical protein